MCKCAVDFIAFECQPSLEFLPYILPNDYAINLYVVIELHQSYEWFNIIYVSEKWENFTWQKYFSHTPL